MLKHYYRIDMKKKFDNVRFSKIPEYIKRAKDLNSTDKLLYGEIYSLSSNKGYCYANNFHFEHWYNLSKSTVTQSISKLQKLNYIRCEYGRNNSRKIFIVQKLAIVENHHSYGSILPSDDENLPSLSYSSTIPVVESYHNNRKRIETNRNEDSERIEKRSTDVLRHPLLSDEDVYDMLLYILSDLYKRYKRISLDDFTSSINNALEDEENCKESITQLGLKEWFLSVLNKHEFELSGEIVEEEEFLALAEDWKDWIWDVLSS